MLSTVSDNDCTLITIVRTSEVSGPCSAYLSRKRKWTSGPGLSFGPGVFNWWSTPIYVMAHTVLWRYTLYCKFFCHWSEFGPTYFLLKSLNTHTSKKFNCVQAEDRLNKKNWFQCMSLTLKTACSIMLTARTKFSKLTPYTHSRWVSFHFFFSFWVHANDTRINSVFMELFLRQVLLYLRICNCAFGAVRISSLSCCLYTCFFELLRSHTDTNIFLIYDEHEF